MLISDDDDDGDDGDDGDENWFIHSFSIVIMRL
jgi:hypothetical protein